MSKNSEIKVMHANGNFLIFNNNIIILTYRNCQIFVIRT